MTLVPTAPNVLLELLVGVGLQRAAEIVYARRTARGLLANGARFVRDDGMGLIVAVHAAWFAACLAEGSLAGVGFGWWTGLGMLLFALGAALRYGSMAALRGRWSTRVFVLPDAPLVTTGPYRFLRHPIYLGVSLELAGLPLAFGLWRTAAVVAVLNALALRRRIRLEEKALGLGAPA